MRERMMGGGGVEIEEDGVEGAWEGAWGDEEGGHEGEVVRVQGPGDPWVESWRVVRPMTRTGCVGGNAAAATAVLARAATKAADAASRALAFSFFVWMHCIDECAFIEWQGESEREGSPDE